MIKDFGIFVPARLNSQRLPNKQILPIGDTCMFEICCKKLNEITKYFDIPTYVLICDKELIDIAVKYPYILIIERDPETVEAEGPLQYIYKDVLDVPEKYLMFLNPCLFAFAAGAEIIERHITYDKKAEGSDHKCSLQKTAMIILREELEETGKILGEPMLTVYPSEYSARKKIKTRRLILLVFYL